MREHEELVVVICRENRLEQFFAVVTHTGLPPVQDRSIKSNFHADEQFTALRSRVLEAAFERQKNDKRQPGNRLPQACMM